VSNLVSLFGIVPEDWNIDKIGNIFTLSQGLQISSTKRIQEKKDNYIPLLKITDLPHRRFSEFVTKIEPQYIASVNDIIYTRTGNVGLVYTDVEGCVHNNCFKVNFDRDLFDKYYVYYYLKSKQVFIYSNQVATGSVQKDLTHPSFKSCIFAYPTLNEQNKIGIIIKNFDDKIELNNQMNQTLEDMATTLFKEWFIDNESNNWKVRTLGSLGKVITGKTPSTKNKDYWGDGIFFITPTDFKNYKKYAFNSERSLSILGKESSKRIVLPKETILVTCIGSDMGKVVIAQNECISNQQINALIIDNDYLQEYVYQYLKHIYPHLRQIAMGGSTMPIINKSAFENIEIILPPIDLLKKFQDIAFSFNQIIIKNTKENQTLKQQRDTLLPKLMSGEIRV
jgi:type I restriction enzyme, S subunit